MPGATRSFRETFAPLRNPNLALYLGGQTVSLVGTWMQATAQSWVVWELSHSTLDLGLVLMLGSLPLLLFGGIAGVWADRLDRRKLLVGTQMAAMLLAFLFAFLVQMQWIQLWHIFLLAFALGVTSALDMPAQTAFVGDLSGVEQVRHAAILNNMVHQVSRMAGPTLAGWVLGNLGVAPAIWINGATFVAVIGSLLVVRAHQARRPPEEHHRGELAEGLRFIAGEPRIQDLLLFTAFMTFFVFVTYQLLPPIVTDFLRLGPEALGLIGGASAAGGLVSSFLIVPVVLRIRRVGWMLAGGLAWIGVWLVLTSLSKRLWLWTVGTFLGGLGGPLVMANAGGLLQMLAPPEMRARVLSVWFMVGFGLQPLAALLAGYTGHLLGAVGAIRFNGVALIAGAAAILWLRPGLRRWEPARHEAAAGTQELKRAGSG